MTQVTKVTLKSARVNVGLTQEEAAAQIGIGLSTLKKWEKGETYPTPPHIDKICELYGVKYDNINFKPQMKIFLA